MGTVFNTSGRDAIRLQGVMARGTARNMAAIFSGTSVIDFGPTGRVTDVAVAVAGVVNVKSESYVHAFFMGDATADNNTDAHLIAARLIRLVAEKVVASQGFSIRALCDGGVFGSFVVHWNWR